VYSVVVATVGT